MQQCSVGKPSLTILAFCFTPHRTNPSLSAFPHFHARYMHMSSSVDTILTGAVIHADDGSEQPGIITIKDGKIHSVASLSTTTTANTIDTTNASVLSRSTTNCSTAAKTKTITLPPEWHVVPGFIDMHIHGANGADTMDATAGALRTISRALPREGVTAFLATTTTQSRVAITAALQCARTYQQRQSLLYAHNNYHGINNYGDTDHNSSGAELLGINLEGPFIAPNMAGAQDKQHILQPNLSLLKEWHTIAGDSLKSITLAPEIAGSDALIKYAVENNIIASIGHTSATYAVARSALMPTHMYRCSHATHLFNAFPPLHHRAPGAATAVLLDRDATVELIADGVHIHPAMLQLAIQLKGIDKTILITDAMRAKGLGDGDYELGGQMVHVRCGVARLARPGAMSVASTINANNEGNGKNGDDDNRALAGSVLTMDAAIRNIVSFTNCTLRDALIMASTNPAGKLGVFANKGSLTVGKDADILVLNNNYAVMLTMCRGKICYMV